MNNKVPKPTQGELHYDGGISPTLFWIAGACYMVLIILIIEGIIRL